MDEQDQKQGKKRRGCLFYGFILVITLLIIPVLVFLLLLRGFLAVSDKAPVPVPETKMSQPEIDKVRQRVDAFREAVRSHKSPEPLSLTADEINALIKSDPDLEPLRGKLYVQQMQADELTAQFSLSVAELGAAKFKDRFFNGYATIKPTLANGVLRLKPVKVVTLRNKPFPEQYLEIIKNLNFAKSLNKSPRVSVGLDWIDSIEIKDGRLVIRPKQNPP